MIIKLSFYAAFLLATFFAVISTYLGILLKNERNMTSIVKFVFLICSALSISLSCLTAYMLYLAAQ